MDVAVQSEVALIKGWKGTLEQVPGTDTVPFRVVEDDQYMIGLTLWVAEI
jgi:hypothetical protein